MNMDDFFAKKPHKIYRGGYTYFRDGTPFAEETFEVFKDAKQLTYEFLSENFCRASSGELLKTNVKFVIGKDWIPQEVIINRSMGEQNTEEYYSFNTRKTKLRYVFDNDNEIREVELAVPPRFCISAPAVASSCLFVFSKKFNNMGRNDYQVISSVNQWEYEGEPSSHTFSLEKDVNADDGINVDGKLLEGSKYILFQSAGGPNIRKDDVPKVNLYLSKHMSIPYMITDEEGTEIKVKYLNQLDDEI